MPSATSYRPATILAATDLSAGCDRILKRGVTLARNLHHELHIVNAWDRRSRVPPEEPELQIRRAQLEAQMAMATADSGIPPFVSHVEPGDPESVIWRLARRARARVVVLGVNEHTPERMRPDTATEVLTELPCSLLAVPLDR